jgi:hypothetical protein
MVFDWYLCHSLNKAQERIVLSIFRTNQLTYSILLLLYAVLLHSSDLISHQNWAPVDSGMLYDFLTSRIDVNGIYGILLAVALITIQATMINYIVLENRVGEDQNLFAGLFFILVSSVSPILLHFSPAMLANTFIILAISQLMSINKKYSAAEPIFNAGFLVGIAALIFPIYIIFALLALAAVSIMRGNQVRELLALTTGLFLPFFLAYATLFLTDQPFQLDIFFDGIGLSKTIASHGNHFESMAALVFYTLAIIVIIGHINRLMGRKNIQIQKKLSIIFWALLTGGLGLLISSSLYTDLWIIITVPVGILLGLVFSTLPGRWAESLHLLLMAAVLIIQYKPYLLP